MNTERRSRNYFETAPRASTVTFDDGVARRNLPYHDFEDALWSYQEPDTITLKMGQWIIVIRGHNLEPLFKALADQSLQSVKAQPNLALDPTREVDSYATEITFLTPLAAPAANPPKRGANDGQLHLKPQGWES